MFTSGFRSWLKNVACLSSLLLNAMEFNFQLQLYLKMWFTLDKEWTYQCVQQRILFVSDIDQSCDNQDLIFLCLVEFKKQIVKSGDYFLNHECTHAQ